MSDATEHLPLALAQIVERDLKAIFDQSETWIHFRSPTRVCLDGDLTLEELEQIVACMRKMRSMELVAKLERKANRSR